jgi:hypothetical protein
MPTEPTGSSRAPSATRFSLAANYDPELVPALKAYPVGEVYGMSAGVRHDALLSIRRGFKIPELRALLQQLDGVTVSVAPARWFRVAAIIRYNKGEHV